jgi:hypothetical protein
MRDDVMYVKWNSSSKSEYAVSQLAKDRCYLDVHGKMAPVTEREHQSRVKKNERY